MPLWSEWLPKLAPGWLQRRWGGGYLSAVGAEQDELLDELIQARKVMMPSYAAAGPATDALAKIGLERGLERGPAETAESYGERLRYAWTILRQRGSHLGLLLQAKVLGFDSANLFVIQRSGRRVTLDVSGTDVVVTDATTPWTFDTQLPRAYAQFGLLFTVAQPSLTWSFSAGFSLDAARLNRIAWRWRPDKADFMGTWIIGTGSFWGWPASRTWGSSNWGGAGGAYIPPR